MSRPRQANRAREEPLHFAVAAVAFDLDGTLLDTVHDLAAATNAWLQGLGERTLATDTIRSLVGKGMANLVRRALALARGISPATLTEDELDESLAQFRMHYAALLGRETTLFPGVRDGLERIAALQLPLAVVSNKTSRFIRPHLERCGIAGYFAVLLGDDDLPTRKPHPGPLLHLCEVFGVIPSQLLMVGDSGIDVAAARAAGCPVVVVPYGYREGATAESLRADAVVGSLSEVADRIRPLSLA